MSEVVFEGTRDVQIAKMDPWFFWAKPDTLVTAEEMLAASRHEVPQERINQIGRELAAARDRLAYAETSRRPS